MDAERALWGWCHAVGHARAAGDDRGRELAEWNIEGLAMMLGLHLATSALQWGFDVA